jgi:hypothetical protein
MRTLTLAAALALLAAMPAGADDRVEMGEATIHRGLIPVLRGQIGIASGSGSAYYCDRGGYCSYTPYGYNSLVLGAEYDWPWKSMNPNLAITFGARLVAAPYYYSNDFMLEPDVGLTWKFTGLSVPVEPRLAVGLGLYLGAYGAGAGLRLGGGASFLPKQKIGFCADLMLDFGRYSYYPVSMAQITVGPEFRF